MVKLDIIHSLNKGLVQSQPLVAVFFGGTSTIGHYTLRALANATTTNGGKGFRAYIVGRKDKAAEDIIAECRGICPQGQFKFVKAKDLSLIQDVDQVCADIIQLEEKEAENPRIDYLMMFQAGAVMMPRKDTKEGLDVTMSLMYYSRMRMILKLLPLLLKSNLPAKVVSVYAAGFEAKLIPEDLSLRDLKVYSYAQARSHMAFMHTLFMESLAKQHASKLGLIHIFPGFVGGQGFESPDLPSWIRVAYKLLLPILRFAMVKPEDSGAGMLSLASSRYPPQEVDTDFTTSLEGVAVGTDGKPGSGAYAVGWNGDNALNAKAYEKIDKDEMRTKVWDHTMKAFEVIDSGKVFTE